ncbi:MAG: hypothetical protein JSS83_26450 [Cyanobacteria bacterium SZAS LIN-3]|nr:hypothetical protein [Cyanobacteria bacterium SZAS LIN-3]
MRQKLGDLIDRTRSKVAPNTDDLRERMQNQADALSDKSQACYELIQEYARIEVDLKVRCNKLRRECEALERKTKRRQKNAPRKDIQRLSEKSALLLVAEQEYAAHVNRRSQRAPLLERRMQDFDDLLQEVLIARGVADAHISVAESANQAKISSAAAEATIHESRARRSEVQRQYEEHIARHERRIERQLGFLSKVFGIGNKFGRYEELCSRFEASIAENEARAKASADRLAAVPAVEIEAMSVDDLRTALASFRQAASSMEIQSLDFERIKAGIELELAKKQTLVTTWEDRCETAHRQDNLELENRATERLNAYRSAVSNLQDLAQRCEKDTKSFNEMVSRLANVIRKCEQRLLELTPGS